MRIGLFVAYWPWFSAEEQVELARLADRGGLDSVWVAEAWGQDAVSVLGHLTAVTERIGLGSALMQIPARTPAATAMAAVTLDVLSEGRFRLASAFPARRCPRAGTACPSGGPWLARASTWRSCARPSPGRDRSNTGARSSSCPSRAASWASR